MNGHVEVGKEPADMKVEYQRATIGTLKGIKKEEQKMKKNIKKANTTLFCCGTFCGCTSYGH